MKCQSCDILRFTNDHLTIFHSPVFLNYVDFTNSALPLLDAHASPLALNLTQRIPTPHELKLAERVERARLIFGPGGYLPVVYKAEGGGRSAAEQRQEKDGACPSNGQVMSTGGDVDGLGESVARTREGREETTRRVSSKACHGLMRSSSSQSLDGVNNLLPGKPRKVVALDKDSAMVHKKVDERRDDDSERSTAISECDHDRPSCTETSHMKESRHAGPQPPLTRFGFDPQNLGPNDPEALNKGPSCAVANGVQRTGVTPATVLEEHMKHITVVTLKIVGGRSESRSFTALQHAGKVKRFASLIDLASRNI